MVGAIELSRLEKVVIKQYEKTVNDEAIVDFLAMTKELRRRISEFLPLHYLKLQKVSIVELMTIFRF
ncbi:MAG: hypothetical protein ACI9VT_003233 [Psychroserpens sp.]